MIPDFPGLMIWLILGANSVAVILSGWYAFRLPSRLQRVRALVGCIGMACVSIATGLSLLVFTLHDSPAEWNISQFLFLLLFPLLTLGLYRLAFPHLTVVLDEREINAEDHRPIHI
jgi:hypothetical protein